LYWTTDGHTSQFGAVCEIDPPEPVCHVSFFEAEAFARHQDARLPSEFEWEAAAQAPHGPSGLLWGMRNTVWQWTSSEFVAYPGFVADPYPEYSEPFLGGGYRVLRGAARLSSPRVTTVQFRNWDLPQRRQIFSGVRLARNRRDPPANSDASGRGLI
jgi:iron(II)-dependent oxidoreductase